MIGYLMIIQNISKSLVEIKNSIFLLFLCFIGLIFLLKVQIILVFFFFFFYYYYYLTSSNIISTIIIKGDEVTRLKAEDVDDDVLVFRIESIIKNNNNNETNTTNNKNILEINNIEKNEAVVLLSSVVEVGDEISVVFSVADVSNIPVSFWSFI